MPDLLERLREASGKSHGVYEVFTPEQVARGLKRMRVRLSSARFTARDVYEEWEDLVCAFLEGCRDA